MASTKTHTSSQPIAPGSQNWDFNCIHTTCYWTILYKRIRYLL